MKDTDPDYPVQFLRGVALATSDVRYTQAAERMERMERALVLIAGGGLAVKSMQTIAEDALK